MIATFEHGTSSGYRRRKCRCEECRAYHAADERRRARNRRAIGIPARARMNTKPRPPRDSVPAARLWPFVQDWIREHDGRARFSRPNEGGLLELARRLDADPRSIARIREQEWVSFNKADRLLVAMDRTDLWHTDLADIYYQTTVAA